MSTESDTPRTDDAFSHDGKWDTKALGMVNLARQLELELNEANETINMLKTRHSATMLCLVAQVDEVIKQRNEWAFECEKNLDALENAVKLSLLLDKQCNALKKALREMLKFRPRSISYQDFHHAAVDQHSENDKCQPAKRFREAWAEAEQALAAATMK